MKKPTEAQIKEFWEWYRFKFIENPTAYVKWAYCYPDGNLYSFTGFPPIDLNNLFKYAVPKVLRVNRYELFHTWVDDITLRSEDPALALFWAIWEVTHQSHKVEPLIVQHDEDNTK